MSGSSADHLHEQAQTKLDRCRSIASRNGEAETNPWSTKTPTHDRQLRQMHAAEGILSALLAIDARLAEMAAAQAPTVRDMPEPDAAA